MPVIPAPGRLRKDSDLQFKASLGCIMNSRPAWTMGNSLLKQTKMNLLIHLKRRKGEEREKMSSRELVSLHLPRAVSFSRERAPWKLSSFDSPVTIIQ